MNVYLGELYKEVEYIQSSGTQYIDTGYIPSNNTKIEMSMGGWNQTGTYNDLFGARESWGSNGKGFLLGHNGTNGDYYSMFNANKSGASMPGFSFIDGNTHNIVMSQNGIYQDGTQKVTFSTVTFTSPVNLTLFALNDNGTTGEYGYFKLYYCKIWDSGTLVRDFIPCYRVSDNTIGLFDKVENKFYANAGTGTFTKGNDVKVFQPELKNAYIGEYVEETYHINASSNLNVYKSGNIINSIVLSGKETGASNVSSEDGHRISVADTTGTYRNGIQLYCGFPSKYGTNVYFQILKLQPSLTTILYTSPYWYSGQGVAAEYELTITRTGWDLRVGTNTASGTFDSSMESIIETLFNGSSVYVIHQKDYGYSTGVDAKVIYGTA